MKKQIIEILEKRFILDNYKINKKYITRQIMLNVISYPFDNNNDELLECILGKLNRKSIVEIISGMNKNVLFDALIYEGVLEEI